MTNRVDSKDIEVIASYWDGYSSEFDEAHNSENIEIWIEQLHKLLGDDGANVKKIIDIGTGTGFLALMLAGEGYELIGVDISREMMEVGIRKAASRGLDVDFTYTLCEELPFEDDKFDAAVNARVLWTLTQPVEALKEWKRVVRPGGRIISFMRVMNTNGGDYYKSEDKKVELPLSNATREDYIRTYKEAGLINVEAIEMPEDMSNADMPHWTAFVGEVPN